MQAATFDFDSNVLTGCTVSQRLFATHLRDAIRTLRPTELDLASVRASLSDRALTIELPHATDPDQGIGAIVSDDEAIVYYGAEHEHFFAEDTASGKNWPIDAPDFAAAAFRLLEQLLLGSVELEIRPGRVMQSTRSYWITDTGDRDLFLKSRTLLPRWRPSGPVLIRFDFGAMRAPGAG